ncbi:MAG: hypothetical protein AABY77_01450, partial [Nitrospirota bacterium]
MKRGVERLNALETDLSFRNLVSDNIAGANANDFAYFFWNRQLAFAGKPTCQHSITPLLLYIPLY